MTARPLPRLSAADVARIAAEAYRALAGGTIRRVQPYGPYALLLEVRRAGRTLWLLAAPDPRLPRTWACRERPRPACAPETSGGAGEAGPFHRAVRARLEGTIVREVGALPGDRILRLEAWTGHAGLGPDAVQEAGVPEAERFTLWIELCGVASNAALVGEDGRILSVLRPTAGKARCLVPGELYAPPPAPRPALGAAPSPPESAEEGEITLEFSIATARVFGEAERTLAREQARASLRAEFGRRRRRLEAARRRLEHAVEAGSRAEEERRTGDLILASLHLVPRGATEVYVPDYYAEGAPPRKVALDPALASSEQAERYFRRARKLARGADVARARLASVTRELLALSAHENALEKDADPFELARLARVRLLGSPRARSEAKLSRQPQRIGRRFRSRDGLEILVGRSNAENERLTLRFARGNDLFLHVQGWAGSHVIVRTPRGKSVPLETMLDAAALAVHYSKLRGASRAEVSATPRKYVRKITGGRPGEVALERYKTLVVIHDRSRLERLLRTAGAEEERDIPS